MIAIWCIAGLIVATISVSTLGAAFSVLGLSALFSGAALAIMGMAASLELAKFVLVAYLHQRWNIANVVFRSYLLFAIVVLSVITSVGIFGFLSDAYQATSIVVEAENIKLASLHTWKKNYQDEITRINRSIEEIPAGQASRRVKFRAELEPRIAELISKSQLTDSQISDSNLNILNVKKKAGPLLYIAHIFNVEVDVVVKYLILTLIFVFDPLAICLVIATSDSLASRRLEPVRAPTVAAAAPPPPSPFNPPKPLITPKSEVIRMRFSDPQNKKVV